jgi:hypothetical protein
MGSLGEEGEVGHSATAVGGAMTHFDDCGRVGEISAPIGLALPACDSPFLGDWVGSPNYW